MAPEWFTFDEEEGRAENATRDTIFGLLPEPILERSRSQCQFEVPHSSYTDVLSQGQDRLQFAHITILDIERMKNRFREWSHQVELKVLDPQERAARHG